MANLAASAMALLPSTDVSVQCTAFSQDIGLTPAGTAIDTETLIVIETPLPWPKPVFKHPLLEGVSGKITAFGGSARVLASVPRDPANRRVFIWRRTGGGASASLHQPSDLPKFLASLDTPQPPAGMAIDPGAVLVCTQGSHDVCCGIHGEQAADILTQIANVPVLRVSHTGGHRFAPTGMTLPDGRMWAFSSPDEFIAAQAATGDANALASKCRGWWGASRGPAQAAEVAVFQAVGFDFNKTDRAVVIQPVKRTAGDDSDVSDSQPDTGASGVAEDSEISDSWVAEVTAGSDTWVVDVSVARMVPTISCEAPGGLPAKPSREFEARVKSGPGI